jgi:Fe-S cluster biosynthesis and repair protein YggX
MTSAEIFIKEIEDRHLKSDQEFVLDSLTGAIDRLQKAFPRYGSFIMEFVQNADDAGSTLMQIEILEDQIRISNNGEPFTYENVKSICKVGRSSKTPKDYIGYLGVGFKSVFLISDSPAIYSGEYKFKFSKTAWAEPSHIPWQIIPLWITDSIESPRDKFTTRFDMPIKEASMLDMLRKEVTDEHLNRRILLFLRSITEIEILDKVVGSTRRIRKKSIRTAEAYEVYQVQEYENDILKSEDNWLLIRSICNVPEKVRTDYITKEWERDHIEKREVSAAFRLSPECNLVSEQRGTAHIGVFSFLPLKEIPSGLSFMIQADFLTNPGRGDLARQCQWNNWLAKEIYKLIEFKCICLFLSDDQWKMNFTKILYPAEGGHELFDTFIKKPLRTYLENNAVLIAEDGTPTAPKELVRIGDEVKELLSPNDIGVLYPSKKVLHQTCDFHFNLKVERGASDAYSLLWGDRFAELLLQKAHAKDVEWFKHFYIKIDDGHQLSDFRAKHYHYYKEYDKFWTELRESQKQFLITENYELARPAEAYMNPNKIRIPDEIKKNMKILHADILKDEKTKAFILKIDIEYRKRVKPLLV